MSGVANSKVKSKRRITPFRSPARGRACGEQPSPCPNRVRPVRPLDEEVLTTRKHRPTGHHAEATPSQRTRPPDEVRDVANPYLVGGISAARKPATRGARCSNKFIEHLEHLRETKDLFDHLGKTNDIFDHLARPLLRFRDMPKGRNVTSSVRRASLQGLSSLNSHISDAAKTQTSLGPDRSNELEESGPLPGSDSSLQLGGWSQSAYLSYRSQSAFFFATTRHGWKALTAQQQQIHRLLCQDFVVTGFCGQTGRLP